MSDILQFGNYFTFDDIQSNTYGVWISGTGTYDAPTRDYTMLKIPGRSGDLYVDNNRFNNIDITYPAFISKSFDTRFDVFKAKLLSKAGYFKLTDTYHPDHFRYATYSGGISPSTGPYNKAGTFDIVFHCKPQRWLVSGLDTRKITSSTTITNPTEYTAKPNIRINIPKSTAGSVTVHGIKVTVSNKNPFTYIDLDCDAMEAHSGYSNANKYVTIDGDVFPTLSPGGNYVTKTSAVTSVEITPRWWTV